MKQVAPERSRVHVGGAEGFSWKSPAPHPTGTCRAPGCPHCLLLGSGLSTAPHAPQVPGRGAAGPTLTPPRRLFSAHGRAGGLPHRPSEIHRSTERPSSPTAPSAAGGGGEGDLLLAYEPQGSGDANQVNQPALERRWAWQRANVSKTASAFSLQTSSHDEGQLVEEQVEGMQTKDMATVNQTDIPATPCKD